MIFGSEKVGPTLKPIQAKDVEIYTPNHSAKIC